VAEKYGSGRLGQFPAPERGEVVRERPEVLRALAKWPKVNHAPGEAVHQVKPYRILPSGMWEFLHGTKQADGDPVLGDFAPAADLAGLNDSEQGSLTFDRHAAQFVEE
jgi:hypothetical protein